MNKIISYTIIAREDWTKNIDLFINIRIFLDV